MAINILDRYGIKEVCDFTFYQIDKDESGNAKPGAPVLYLDTLKVSTTEQTAENTSARGGKGAAALLLCPLLLGYTGVYEGQCSGCYSILFEFKHLPSRRI